MKLKFDQVQNIVLKNPHKKNIDFGKEKARKLMLHLHGHGMDGAIKHSTYFANKDLFEEQKKYAISNKDVFGRLLQQEDMVYTARGGSSYFSLGQTNEDRMNELLANVRFGMSLRKWVRNFAHQAYRCDPMGIILMETEVAGVDPEGDMNEPNTYPTYKSIFSIYDYETNGRNLEYVCFRLKAEECREYGINDTDIKDMPDDQETEYFRIIDDNNDMVVKRGNDIVTIVNAANMAQPNPIPNKWGVTPGFVISDLMLYNDSDKFVSPLELVVELADSFLEDRSVRNLQKKYHGFAKAVEPLLRCSRCNGAKTIDGAPCPECTPPGAKEGTGFKFKTKPSDVARFPIEDLENGFDWRKYFGYVTPDIESWNKQDMSLEDLEELMEMTYWGTVRMQRPKPAQDKSKGGDAITATESNSNQAPKIARLNMTADWVEKTENAIAWFIGKYWFPDTFKKPAITLGREYILDTPDDLMDKYVTLRSKGAPDFTLDEALEKYYHARYNTNPIMLQKYLKMLDVEPFPHLSIVQAKGIITEFKDYSAKLYFGEWANTVPDIKWVTLKADVLKVELAKYMEAKGLTEPTPAAVPVK